MGISLGARSWRPFTALRFGLALAAAVAARPAQAAHARPTERGPDSLSVAEIRALIELHHPNVLAGDPGASAVWIVVDAGYNYRWSTADNHATVTGVLLRARRAEVNEAIARVRSAAERSPVDRREESVARAELDRVVRDLKRYATLADVSHVDVAALPDFLDTDQMAQSLVVWNFRAGELAPTPLKVTAIRLRPAAP